MPDDQTSPELKALTPKQKRFCDEYLIDFNGAQAAIRAGYSEHTAREIASQNLSKLHIKQYVLSEQAKLSEKTGVSQQWVLDRLKLISDRCVSEVKLDSAGANRSTELLGKHLGMFKEAESTPPADPRHSEFISALYSHFEKQLGKVVPGALSNGHAPTTMVLPKPRRDN